MRTFESISGLPVRILGIRYCCEPCLALLEVCRRLPVVVPEAARRVRPEGARAEQPLRAVCGVHGAARDALRRRLDFRDVVCDARVKHLSAMAHDVLCRRGVACGGGAAACGGCEGSISYSSHCRCASTHAALCLMPATAVSAASRAALLAAESDVSTIRCAAPMSYSVATRCAALHRRMPRWNNNKWFLQSDA